MKRCIIVANTRMLGRSSLRLDSPPGRAGILSPLFTGAPACSLPVVSRCASGSLSGKLPLAADGIGNRVPSGDGRHRRSRRPGDFAL